MISRKMIQYPNMKIAFALLFLLSLLAPQITEAVVCNGVQNGLNLCYPAFPGLPVQLSLTMSIDQLVAWIYTLLITSSGVAAFGMITWGGIQWLTSRGNPSAVSDARDRIQKALLGLLIVLASFLILQVVNPDLTVLRSPQLEQSQQP